MIVRHIGFWWIYSSFFQLTALRSLMANNYRPVLALNPKGIGVPRVLYQSWSGSANGNHGTLILTTLMAIASIFSWRNFPMRPFSCTPLIPFLKFIFRIKIVWHGVLSSFINLESRFSPYAYVKNHCWSRRCEHVWYRSLRSSLEMDVSRKLTSCLTSFNYLFWYKSDKIVIRKVGYSKFC